MKKFSIALSAIISLCILTSCNHTIIDTTYTFDKAIIQNVGTGQYIIVDIDNWTDYDGEQLQLKLTDGSVILVSSFNTILVNGEDSEIFELFPMVNSANRW